MNLYTQWNWLNNTRIGKTVMWSFMWSYFTAMILIGVGGLTLYNYWIIKAVLG